MAYGRKTCIFSFKSAGFDTRDFAHYEKVMHSLLIATNYTAMRSISSFLNNTPKPPLLWVGGLLDKHCPWCKSKDIALKLPSRTTTSSSTILSQTHAEDLHILLAFILSECPIPQEIYPKAFLDLEQLFKVQDTQLFNHRGTRLGIFTSNETALKVKALLIKDFVSSMKEN